MTLLIEVKVQTLTSEGKFPPSFGYYAFEIEGEDEVSFKRDLETIETGAGPSEWGARTIGAAIANGVRTLAEWYRGFGIEPGLKAQSLMELDLEAIRRGEPQYVNEITLEASWSPYSWNLI